MNRGNWVRCQLFDSNMPVNLNNIYSVYMDTSAGYQRRILKQIGERSARGDTAEYRPYLIYFASGGGMSEDECVMQWSFVTYEQACATLSNLSALMEVQLV